LTPQVQKYYKQLKEQMMIEAAGVQISAVNAAAGLSKLLQISGGAVYTDKKAVLEFDIQPRFNALMETIDETEHKVIIFVPFRHTIEIVSKYLTEQGIDNQVIQGDVSATQRANIINQFQTMENPRVLVIQPQSASHGVTLTAANTVVFWSPVMSVETYLQCIARMDRVGQKNKMTVVHLQGSEVEKKMYAMLQGKVDLHTKLVDLYREELEK
jgi:SNF2 family DNA or RNA helicase